MDWELINGITGIIGALGTIVTAIFHFRGSPKTNSHTVFAYERFSAFLLASFSWAAITIIVHWLFDPLGPIVTSKEEMQIFAFAVCFPPVVGFVYGIRMMLSTNKA